MGGLTFLDVCAGAGGLSAGFVAAGFDTTGVELDDGAVATHVANVGPCVRADLRTYRAPQRYRVVGGGIPCQSFSQAGAGEGTADARGQLYRELLRVAREAEADVCFLENVRGMLWTVGETGARAVDEIVGAFERDGWHVRWRMFNCADYGVPQLRERLVVAGFRTAELAARFRWPAPTHAAPGGMFGLPPWVTLAEALGLPRVRVPAARVGAGYQGGGKGRRRRAGDRMNELLSVLAAPAHVVSAGGTGTGAGGGAEPFANAEYRAVLGAAIEASGLGARPATTVLGTPVIAPAGHHRHVRTGAVNLAAAARRLDAPAPVVKANSWHEGSGARASQRPSTEAALAVAAVSPRCGRDHGADLVERFADRPGTTVDTVGWVSPPGNHDRKLPSVRLTLAQCTALQTFPPTWRWLGRRVADNFRYVGNAVPPLFAQRLAAAFAAVLA